jgi:hypothetical protein
VGKQVPGGLYLAAMPVTIRSAAGFKHCGPEGQESKIVEDAMTKSVPDWLRNRCPEPTDWRAITRLVSVILLLANLGIMLAALVKYHVWSIMQGRLLFPSFFGFLAVFAVGADRVERTRWGSKPLRWTMASLCVLFMIYLFGEIVTTAVLRLDPGIKQYLKTMAA